MALYLWIVAAAGGLAALCLALVLCLRRKPQALGLEVVGCEVSATGNERQDWRVRLQAVFANKGGKPLAIATVAFLAEPAEGGAGLSPKRVTGDKTRIVAQRGRGPDLAMRLPIALRPQGTTDFTFDVFFSHSLQRLFGEGAMRVDAVAEDGQTAQRRFPLPRV